MFRARSFILPVLFAVFGNCLTAQNPSPFRPCFSPTAFADLEINNVRARIMNGGDWWWDLNTARYEIPKGSGMHSLFSGAIWIGGLDAQGQLKVAAMTYRQTGNDFWPGPLDTTSLNTITDSTCWEYDHIYNVSRSQVEEFRQRYNDPSYQIPADILNWPGNGNTARGETKFLAPFADVDGDGEYNPLAGDYPGYNFSGSPNCEGELQGDQTLWWVFNDQGNQHTETGGNKLGFEIQAQAFAFNTNDAINDMTFMQYKVINRSTYTINQFYWGNYVDADLGYYGDDWVGCDVMRGMGYCYNGDSDDGGSAPGTYGLSPPAVGFDFIGGPLADPNDGIDNDRDSTVDESGERFKMSVFKYDGGDNPSGGQDFYNYLKGWWRDGTPQTYGGSGHNTGLPCSFMFPGLSDPYGWGTNGIPQSPWYDVNLPADRRFLTSVGPFTMSPGEVQYITVAMPWARDTAGDNLDAIIKLQQADDLAQQLFDNCFQLPCSSPTADFTYIASELDVDFFYPYSMALTYSWDFGDGGTSTQKFPQHTYSADGTYNVCLIVTNSCGSDTICKPIKVNVTPEVCGVKLQRMEGQGSGGLFLDLTDSTINEILSSPQHRSLHPIYNAGQGPVFVNITNIDNVIEGNYAIFFDTIAASSRWKMYRIGSTDTVYADSVLGADNTQHIPQWGMSVYVRQCVTPGFLTDPTKGYVGASMTFADHTKQWLTALADKDGFSKDNWIRSGYQADQTGSACLTSYNDYYNADNEENYEGVLGGTWAPYRLCASTNFNNDPNCYTAGPSRGSSNLSLMKNLPNVDLVITPDKSKWSRCPVLEMCDDFNLAIGGARKCFLRRSPSVDKDGQPDNTGTGMGWFPGYAINVETGERLNIMFGEDSWLASENGRDMIWNPTTSVYSPNNVQLYGGRHYIYVMRNSNLPNNVPMYDSGAFIHAYLLGTPSNGNLNDVFSCAAWVNIPLLKPGHSLLETEVRIRLRVARPYSKYVTTPTPQNNNYPLYQFRLYKKELSCYMYEGPDILFPSPFSDQALLQFANPDRKPYQLKIYNLAGQVVQVYDNITDDQVIIRKGQLAAGAYIYSLIAEGEKPRSGKFVVINQ